jgi:hypothetical protein
VSVHVTSYILRHSEARLGDRLVLLALGDHAHHDGTNAYASVEKLALEARLSERQVQRCLRRLETAGHIEPTGVAQHGQIVYRVIMGRQNVTPDKMAGATTVTESVSDLSPKPSKEPSGRTSDEVLRVSEALETHIKEVTGKGKKLTQADLKTIDRMGRLDGVNLDEVVRFLHWLTASGSEVAQFWAPNILSASKLREKFPQVRAQAARERGSANRRRDGMTDEQHRAAVLEGARRVDESGR